MDYSFKLPPEYRGSLPVDHIGCQMLLPLLANCNYAQNRIADVEALKQGGVRGLTTAAGLWVAAGIGMATGAGLYVVGIVTTIFVLIGLEVFGSVFQRFHTRNIQLVFTTCRHSDLFKITNLLNENNCRVL